MPTARVLVVHDYPLIYEGIRSVLGPEPGIEVVGEARNAADALGVCSENPPDVIVVDLCLESAEVIMGLKQVRALGTNVKTVALTMPCGTQTIRKAIAYGVQGVLCKNAHNSRLIAAIRTVFSNQFYVDPELTELFAKTLAMMVPDDGLRAEHPTYEALSARERQVFAMLANGMSNKMIAFELGISRKTVETHHLRITRKLGLRDSVELFRYAARIGVIDIEEWRVT